MRQLKSILLAGVTVLFFTACNDDTTIISPNIPTIDNSLLADGENQYGYYGSYVEFGESVLTNKTEWRIVDTRNGDEITINFYDDGNADYLDNTQVGSFVYGVLKDGTVITNSDDETIEFIKSFERFEGLDSNGNDIYSFCYLLKYEQRFGDNLVEACDPYYSW